MREVMGKVSVVFGALLVVVGVLGVADGVPEHIKSFTMNISKQCKAKVKPSKDDLELIKENVIPDSKTGLCYLQCLLEKMGVIVNEKFRSKGNCYFFLDRNWESFWEF